MKICMYVINLARLGRDRSPKVHLAGRLDGNTQWTKCGHKLTEFALLTSVAPKLIPYAHLCGACK